jgi:hypothetical protein
MSLLPSTTDNSQVIGPPPAPPSIQSGRTGEHHQEGIDTSTTTT